MKIAVIGTVGVPSKYGGFETFAENLLTQLRRSHEFTVYCSARAYDKKIPEFRGARLVYLPFKANGIQSILYDAISIVHALRKADVLLILGVSGCSILPLVRLFSRKRTIVNVDGLEWKRSKWNRFARFFLKASEKIAATYADAVVCDHEDILGYVESHYGARGALIAYGSDHVRRISDIEPYKAEFGFLGDKYALGVCRIEPENNPDMILAAVGRSASLHCVFVGNWDASRYGKALKERYSKYGHISFLDPIYDREKLDVVRSNCFVYLHGHSAGGTNPSLVEAMYLGRPVIAYDVSFNRVTTGGRALYFSSSDELAGILGRLRPEILSRVSRDMEELAHVKYLWKDCAAQYDKLFREVTGAGRPDRP